MTPSFMKEHGMDPSGSDKTARVGWRFYLRGSMLAVALLLLVWVAFDIHHRFFFGNIAAAIALLSRLFRQRAK